MSKVQRGDRVRVQYFGLLPNGQPIADTPKREVLVFTAGGQEVIPGISNGVVGMAIGDQKRMTLSAEEAFGPVDGKLRKEVSRQRFGPGLELYVGKRLMAIGVKSGRRRRVRVVELYPETVIVDANHPLAGKTVEVELQLIARRPSTPEA